TRFSRDWSSDVCSSDLTLLVHGGGKAFLVGLAFRGGHGRVLQQLLETELCHLEATQIKLAVGNGCPAVHQQFFFRRRLADDQHTGSTDRGFLVAVGELVLDHVVEYRRYLVVSRVGGSKLQAAVDATVAPVGEQRLVGFALVRQRG